MQQGSHRPSGSAAYLKHGGLRSRRKNVLIGWAHLDGLPGRLVNNGAPTKRRVQGHCDPIRAVVGVPTKPTPTRDLDTNLGTGLHHFGSRVLVACRDVELQARGRGVAVGREDRSTPAVARRRGEDHAGPNDYRSGPAVKSHVLKVATNPTTLLPSRPQTSGTAASRAIRYVLQSARR